MRGRRGALSLALAVVGVGLVVPAAHAVNSTSSTLYVQTASLGQTCSDSGPGSSSQPFCTISKAASVVQPGQTVMVGYGDYPETVTISAKGTAAAPIKFVGESNFQSPFITWVGGSSVGVTSGDHAFVLSGAQYVTISGFGVSGKKESVLVQNSQHVTVDQIGVGNQSATTPDVRVAGSAGVTVNRSTLPYGVELDSGTSGATIVDDVITHGPQSASGPAGPAILATDATGTTIVNDTIVPACGRGVDLEGASTGSTIENLVVNTSAGSGGAACGTPDPAITVASGSASGTKSDYNVVFAGIGGVTLYSWAGTSYADAAAFTAATGQGGHDVAADPKLVPDNVDFLTPMATYPTENAPEIDSADGNLAPAIDIAGHARVDDPLVPNTGSGPVTYADRGAYEFQDPFQVVPPTVAHVPGAGPLDVDITTGVTHAWTKNVTYTYKFDAPGGPAVVSTSSTLRQHFPAADVHSVSVSATDGVVTSPQPGQPNPSAVITLGADYTPLSPVRILDTRHAIGVGTTTPVPANSDVVLQVAGVDGIVSGRGLSAVVLNVTAAAPTGAGYLTVYPDGAVLSGSTLNFGPGQVVPNLVTVQVLDGKVRFHNGSAGTVHIVADAEGYYADSGYGNKSISPVRVLDTRNAIGVPTTTPVPANGHLQLDLSSKVPAGTKAVTLNVTVTRPTAGGYITVYPDGASAPTASNLNFVPGQTVPNLVTVPVSNGKVDFKNGSAGTVHLVADLAGYYGDSTTDATFGYLPFGPQRVIDTRISGTGPIGADATLNLALDMFSGAYSAVPATGDGVLVNVTVTRPTSGGYLTVFPAFGTRPTASNLNFGTGQTVANLVSAVFDSQGIDVYNGSAGQTDVVVDLEGYFVPPLP